MNLVINTIIDDLSEVLDIEQKELLRATLFKRLKQYDTNYSEYSNTDYIEMFIAAKSVEGCSSRTLTYYKSTIEKVFSEITIPIGKVTTDILREYIATYQGRSKCGKVTIDNIRRIMSSFFSWLENEDFIIKSPVRRIHKIRKGSVVKETFSDENIELMRDNCKELRDLAILDLLYSTGIRVGELVNLDVSDINFEERECIVFGKGDKERKVYFDARTKIHLKEYIKTRDDNNPALFVTLQKPYNRLKISGVEIRVRELGRRLHIDKVHPHKFRRSMATRAIDKGMPIEQVQKLLGHSQIDTTMQYAMVNQNNVKNSHRRYIG